MDLFTESGATFSECSLYRYRLWRYWDRSKPSLCFLMLNPSTADIISNDPTVERCRRRAMSMGLGGLEVVNIFAYRSTDPSALYTLDDPVGPDNDQAIRDACAVSGLVVCAWGGHGNLHNRGQAVLDLIRSAGVTPHYLVLNSDGTPKHPLYVGYDLLPVEWKQ